jgi:membrane-associated protease RseP (regulator of RpoE activity)
MRHIYMTGIALVAMAAMPLLAQKPTRLQRVTVSPEIADFETSGRSYLGVGVSDISTDRQKALKLKDDRGVEVTQVDQDAPAGKAGIKEHDVIVSFNGTPVESEEQFKRLMRETPPGRTVSLDIIRDGQQQNLKVQVADRKKMEHVMAPRDFQFAMPAMPPMPAMPDFPRAWTDTTVIRTRSNTGATLESLSPQLGDYFGVKNGEGMLVRSVQKGSPADSAGLRAGDVVIRVGDQKITDRGDWSEALRNNKNGKAAVVIVRDKKEQTLSISVPSRNGRDSSALHEQDDILDPDVEIEAADNASQRVEPFAIVQSVQPFADFTTVGPSVSFASVEPWDEDVVDEEDLDEVQPCDHSDISSSIHQAMKQLHHQLVDNRSELNRNLSQSVKFASATMKVQSAEVQKALREAQREIENVRIRLGSEIE